MIERRLGPRWPWVLVVLAAVVGILGGWWLYGVLTVA